MLISVVIPVYNRTWELRRALQSLVIQSYKNFEVIICDDGSTDDITLIINEFKFKLSIVFIRIENSGGPARPRNIALQHSRGLWISFLDSDDWWDSQRLEIVAHSLCDNLDFVYHPLRIINKYGQPIRRGLSKLIGVPIKGDVLRYMALFGNPIPTSAAVVRKSKLVSIGGMCEDANLIAFEDFDAWLRLAEFGIRVGFIDKPLGSYWIGDDSISAVSEIQIRRQVCLFERHIPHFGTFSIEALARQDYTLGVMWSSIKGCSDIACAHLLRANKLPTLMMQINRILIYIRLRLFEAK